MTEHKHYLSAGGMVFAMQITRSGNLAQGGSTKPAESLRYLHTDHLGSVAVVTDDTGSVSERLAFDPWGKRRFPNGTADVNDTIVGLTIVRGFTMHEHLDEMGLIHMNGRIFDPLIGRFMSADPFIPDASNLQAHNRFAYVYNNPLKFTDPDGFKPFWKKKWFKAIVAIAASFVLGPGGYAPFFSSAGVFGGAAGFANAVAAGFVSGGISSGSLKGAFQGALSGALFFGAGQFASAQGLETLGKVATHAVVGCVSSVTSGGSCGSGALAAGFGKFTTLIGPGWVQNPEGFGQIASGAAYAAISGGIGSVLGGGKFENGAMTVAFGYLFNQVVTARERADLKARREYDAKFFQKLNTESNQTLQIDGVQDVVQVGGSAGLLIGSSRSLGVAGDSSGGRSCVMEECLLVGPFVGLAGDAGVQVTGGKVGSGWSVLGFGKLAAPLGGGEVNFGYGSDGFILGFGGSVGGMGGGGVKICAARVVQSKASICN